MANRLAQMACNTASCTQLPPITTHGKRQLYGTRSKQASKPALSTRKSCKTKPDKLCLGVRRASLSDQHPGLHKSPWTDYDRDERWVALLRHSLGPFAVGL